ncbi:hypothetical protein ABIA39_004274 [Nocardia sp. GAS34]
MRPNRLVTRPITIARTALQGVPTVCGRAALAELERLEHSNGYCPSSRAWKSSPALR